MTIHVTVGGARVSIERSVFTALLEQSVVYWRKPYKTALATSEISFDVLVELARKAEIPYSLFFSPQAVVDAQIKKKIDTLLAGVGKDTFSLNSRNRVELRDVELIVKDLLRKQELLKRLDGSLGLNPVIGCLKRSKAGVPADAVSLRNILGFTIDDVRESKTKDAALNLMIDRFEATQLLVSRSQQNFMPQNLVPGVKFSGMCVKDRKVPYLFLTGGDSGDNPEPAGRQLFTLVLLAVLVARERFAPVTYDDYADEPISAVEYELTEEILMPADMVKDLSINSIEALKSAADAFRVTPSAMVMRARRIGVLTPVAANAFLDALHTEFAVRAKPKPKQPRAVNAIRRYNGAEFSRRMVRQLDAGTLSAKDFCRVVALNRLKPSQIGEFKAAL
jgi:hypothetical protein